MYIPSEDMHSRWGTSSFPVTMCIPGEAHPDSREFGCDSLGMHILTGSGDGTHWECASSPGMHKVYTGWVFTYLNEKSSYGLQMKQCLAAHYFNWASTDKQFCQLMVGLVETLTVGLVETLNNLYFFFIMKAKLYFLEINLYDFWELADWFTQPISRDLSQQNSFAGRWGIRFKISYT